MREFDSSEAEVFCPFLFSSSRLRVLQGLLHYSFTVTLKSIFTTRIHPPSKQTEPQCSNIWRFSPHGKIQYQCNNLVIMLLGFQIFYKLCFPNTPHVQLWYPETSKFLLSLNKASDAECPLFPGNTQDKYTPLGLKSYITKSGEYTRCFLIFKIKKLRPKLAYRGPRREPGPQWELRSPSQNWR